MGENVPNPCEQDPWKLARKRFCEDLSAEEKSVFKSASLENVLDDANTAQHEHQRRSKTRAGARRLYPFVEKLNAYGKAMDVYVNASPTILSLLWGSVRVLLKIAEDVHAYYEKLVDMLLRIGDLLPRAKAYSHIFRNSPLLVETVADVYLDIIRFCTKAKEALRAPIWKKPSTWKSFKKDNNETLDGFWRHVEAMDNAAQISHMGEASAAVQLQLMERDQRLARSQQKTRSRLLSRLPSIDNAHKQRKLSQLRHASSGSWLFDEQQFLDWRDGEGSSCLWCSGIPGCGKSVLASSVVDACRGNAMAYHYCDDAVERSLDATNILGTLIKQLLSKGPIPSDVEDKIQEYYEDGSRIPDVTEMASILDSVSRPLSRIFLVIDGLDECEKDQWIVLLPVIERLARRLPQTIKIFITSRENVEITAKLEGHHRISMSQDKVDKDIAGFVHHIVKHKLESGEMRIKTPTLETEVTRALVEGARGCFLWVRFQVAELCEAMTEKAIRETLQNLPRDIVEIYSRILRKIIRSTTTAENIAIIQRVLKWTACSRRPLHLDELTEAVAFSKTDTSWDGSKLPTDGLQLIQSCRGLVTLDNEDQSTRFAHYTVKQFLLSEALIDLSCAGFHSEFWKADMEVGEQCVAYLSFSDFETLLTKPKPSPTVAGTQVLGRITSQLPYGRGIARMTLGAWKLFQGDGHQRAVDIDLSRFANKLESPSDFMQNKYRLLNYTLDNWVWHTESFSSEKTDLWSKFKMLAANNNTLFKARLWKEVPDSKDFPYLSLFRWAARNGHVPLLRLLEDPPLGPSLSFYCERETARPNTSPIITASLNDHIDAVNVLAQYCAPDLQLKQDQRPLFAAIVRGHVAMVGLLLQCGADSNGRDGDDEPLLNRAAATGNDQIVHLLLHSVTSPADPEQKNRFGDTALSDAVRFGHVKVVRELLAASAQVNPGSASDATEPLMSAALHNHIEVTELLVLSGADVDFRKGPLNALQTAAGKGHVELAKMLMAAKADVNADIADAHGRTALQAAAGSGSVELVQILLAANADVNAKPARIAGETALHAAAAGGHLEVVRILLASQADINALTSLDGGGTALQAAAGHGHLEIVHELLAAGAEINSTESEPQAQTALQVAAAGGHTKVVEMLLAAGAEVNSDFVGDYAEKTPLQAAAAGGNLEILGLLIDANAEIDVRAAEHAGKTALQAASCNGHIEVVKKLLAAGANVNAEPARQTGRTALQGAAEFGHVQLVALLLEKGADVNAEPGERDGRTALQAAAGSGHDAMVSQLLQSGADVEGPLATHFGRTALQAAAERGHAEVVSCLIRKGANVSAPPAPFFGTTALDAARSGGHTSVLNLIKSI